VSRESSTSVERIEPAQTPPLELALHVSRYRFASRLVEGKIVLDAGCGVGYGSRELRLGPAGSYVGVDRSPEAIRAAQREYAAPDRFFLRGDVTALPFADGHFEAVLSFEVIEHLREVHRYLAELRRVLRSTGACVISTPNRRWLSADITAPDNPYHVREYDVGEFRELVGAHFPEVQLVGQHEGARAGVVRRAERSYGLFLERMGLRRLRHLVPIGLRAWIHSLVVDLMSRSGGVRPVTIESRDFDFTTDRVEDARILLAVCRAP